MSMLLEAARYENYNSVMTSLETEKLNCSSNSQPPPSSLPIEYCLHRPFSWTRSCQTFHL